MRDFIISVSAILIYSVVLFIASANAMPRDSLYNVKRLSETVQEKFAVTPQQKGNFYISLVKKRGDELLLIHDAKDANVVLSASARYSATVGTLVALLKDESTIAYKAEAVVVITDYSDRFKEIVENPYLDSENKKHIQDAINYSELYLEELGS